MEGMEKQRGRDKCFQRQDRKRNVVQTSHLNGSEDLKEELNGEGRDRSV